MVMKCLVVIVIINYIEKLFFKYVKEINNLQDKLLVFWILYLDNFFIYF